MWISCTLDIMFQLTDLAVFLFQWDLCWFVFLLLVFVYVTVWFYFWLVCGDNDYDFINW